MGTILSKSYAFIIKEWLTQPLSFAKVHFIFVKNKNFTKAFRLKAYVHSRRKAFLIFPRISVDEPDKENETFSKRASLSILRAH